MNIAGVEIGAGHPCRFVAEIGNAHNGDFNRCLRLIDAASATGADFVKLQCYTPDELVALRGDGPAPEPWGSQGWTMQSLYAKAATPFAWFPALVVHCRSIGIPWFSSVFGKESLALLESLECPAYKIARLDNQSAKLSLALRANRKPVIVSMTGGESRPIGSSLRLWCPPGYPQTRFGFESPASCNGDYDNSTFDDFEGFSFHGTNPLPCVVAATLGAKIIEAHLHLDEEPSELESNVSLTASQFAQMVRDVRRVEEIIA